ncbi:unnamed protein product [Urochloa humidicola]
MSSSTPPLALAGDPPAATHSTSLPSGNPPAATHTTPPLSGDPPATTPGRDPCSRSGEALDLGAFSGSASSSSNLSLNRPGSKLRANLRGSELRPGASYKEALVGTRTFKPRFDTSRRPGDWQDNSTRQRSARSTVWGRLGPRPTSIHDRLGERVPMGQQDINGYLHILKAKTIGRCYNCFASDHRIASCRDPPRCILCSRSGHKARSCPSSAQVRRLPNTTTAVWRRCAPVAGASASGVAASDLPLQKTASTPSSEMDFIPGESWRRPERVLACAARTSEVREAERDLQLHALVAVQLDARMQLTCDGVRQDALLQLRITARALQVTRISTSSFLLRFQTPELRNLARARGALAAGRTSLHLMPWGRQVSAAAARGHLFYRARICFEGVPYHAHHIESVLHLLPKQSFVEGIDYVREREDEKGCFILWIWCKDPDAISVLGTLQIEEPMILPEEYCNDNHDAPSLRSEEVSTLKYDVLIHLDRVEDYNPPPCSPSRGSFESDRSGIPTDEPMVQWPMRHNFDWQLGQPDALPEPPRMSVHSRLGDRRDRSPPRGGGGGGGVGGLHQMPPPNHHDMARSTFGAGWPGLHRNAAGGSYHGHSGSGVEPQDSFLPSESFSCDQTKTDPMMEEASLPPSTGYSQPKPSQCSVEPTVTERATAVPDLLVWERESNILMAQQPKICNELGAGIVEAELIDVNEPSGDMPLAASPRLQSRQDNVLDLLTSPGSAEPMFGKMFDLNMEWEIPGGVVDTATDCTDNEQVNAITICIDNEGRKDRDILAPADERLNKQGKEHTSHKSVVRGIARLAIPLKKSLLCTPAHKHKLPLSRKIAGNEETAHSHGDKKGSTSDTSSIDDRATALLMKTSGIFGNSELPTEAALLQLGNQFVTPMEGELISDMRTTFGIPDSRGTDALSALVCDVDADDD